jgi:hypothetical protein
MTMRVMHCLHGTAFKCRTGFVPRTLVVTCVSPPEPSRLEDAQRTAGRWRVKIRVDPKGRRPWLDEGGGAGVREPRTPIPPSGSGRAELQSDAE